MTLPILLIFYVSMWKNNKKHWKIRIWRHCDVIIGRGKAKLGVALLCTEMIIVCKFHDPGIIGSRDTEAGSEEPPSQIDQKSPVWIGLRENSLIFLNSLSLFFNEMYWNQSGELICMWILAIELVQDSINACSNLKM